MKILFIETDTERDWAVAALGPGFIAAYLRQAGHEVAFLRATVELSTEEVVARAQAEAPGLIGLSLTTRQWLRGRELGAALRASLGVPVIAGGLHPTFAPEEVLAAPGFDYVCLGEGEEATLELVEALERGAPTDRIANVWAKGAPRPSLRPPFSPLDRMPFTARDLLDERPGVVHVSTQRGCPFPCTYCGARMFDQLYAESGADYGRRRTIENVLAELTGLREAGKLAYVIFLDDTFTINHPWVKAFCREYGAALRAPFSLHARVETVNERMLHLLAEAGCAHIVYGVESGSERIRRDVMRRPVTNQRFRDVFRWTREAGIMVTANYMLGVPEETRDDLEQTLALAEELDAYDFGYFVFYPYPGTALFHTCRERGYLPEDYQTRPANHRQSILRLPTLTQDDISEFYERFTALRERLYVARQRALAPEADTEGLAAELRSAARSG